MARLSIVSALLAGTACSMAAGGTNYLCKNGTSDWPLPCRPAADGWRFRFREFPISAWWGPVGYNNEPGSDPKSQLAAYARANYTLIQLSDRQAMDCNHTAQEAWQFILESTAHCEKLGMQVLIDTYSPLTRPWNDIKGGYAQVVTNSPLYMGQWVDLNMSNTRSDTVAVEKKITLPELQWMALQVRRNPAVVGLLLTDDGADLSSEEIAMAAWCVVQESIPGCHALLSVWRC